MESIRQSQYDNIKAISEGDVAFGFSMMPHLGKGNVTFSPYSIRTALAMVYEGARGASAKEISDVAFIPEDKELRQRVTLLIDMINSKNKDYTLRTANELWIENQFSVNPEFVATLNSAYGAESRKADFVNNAGYCRDEINKWVSQQTEKKIPELFPEGSIDANTVVALANALYFRGFWENKFDSQLTQKQDYTLPNGEVVQVDMMRKGAVERQTKLPKFEYGSFDGFQIAILPYKGHELAKVIMLAPKGSSISQLEEILQKDPKTFTAWIERLDKTSLVRLEIPKHEVRGKYSLNTPLKLMGIKRIFDLETADLSGIGEGPLFIGSGHHQAYFKSDEEGSEGAAATGFVVMKECLMIEPEPVEFVADRPFLEMIIHKPTNALLFLNRIEDPR